MNTPSRWSGVDIQFWSMGALHLARFYIALLFHSKRTTVLPINSLNWESIKALESEASKGKSDGVLRSGTTPNEMPGANRGP